MRASGLTVLRQIANRMGILNIEVETGWTPDHIRELAEEEGYSFDSATGRFHRATQTTAGTGEAGDSTDAHEAAAQSPTVLAVPTVTGTGGDPAPVSSLPLATAPVPHVVEVTPVSQPPVAPAPTVAPTAPVVEVDASAPPATSTTVTDPSALIAAGLAHVDDDIGDLALQAKVAIDRLAVALVEWEQRSEARADVIRLEAERERVEQLLTEARRAAGITTQGGATALSPEPTKAPRTAWMTPKNPHAKPPVGVSYADLKVFSDEHGHGWSGRGRPTNVLIDAYRAHHADVAS